ncbi:hypothetical protein [Chryseobacterium aquaticum]|uniref:hypothetical protein n=1 Tax=Chryseobacterium aquaticum TaxID=452084 RepID=UPI002FCA76A1
MSHIGLKPSLEIKTDFDIKKVLDNVEYPEESKNLISSYMNSDKFAEHYDYDVLIQTNTSLIAGFECFYNGNKIMMQEINPVTVYYSNAIMSNYLIENYKKILLEKTKKGIISSHAFGNFFQLAFNCIINLQASIEMFLNYILNENKYMFYDKNNKIRKSSIHEKIDFALVNITGKTFKDEYNSQYINIKDLINIRNEMIHLKPDEKETNSKYKTPYRKIIDFKFDETVEAVKAFINYYKENLIEECSCGKDFYFDIINK